MTNFLILHTLATMYDHSGANEVCTFLYWTDHPQSIFESIVINLESSNQQLLSYNYRHQLYHIKAKSIVAKATMATTTPKHCSVTQYSHIINTANLSPSSTHPIAENFTRGKISPILPPSAGCGKNVLAGRKIIVYLLTTTWQWFQINSTVQQISKKHGNRVGMIA